MALVVPEGTPDARPGLVALIISLLVLVILATIGRISAKFVVRQYWWWDDFFALLAFPSQLILLGLLLAWKDIGLGLPVKIVAANNPVYISQGQKYLYVAIFFFDGAISFSKLSAIFFYARIFGANNKRFVVNLWIAGGLTVGWIVSSFFSSLFQCVPIQRAWDQSIDGHCINNFAWYLSTAILSSVIDFYILIIPVPMIWRLQASKKRRIYLLAAFFLAYSVVVTSFGRVVLAFSVISGVTEDLTKNFVPYLYWAVLEASISVIGINVPNTIGLLKVIRRRVLLATQGAIKIEAPKTTKFSAPSAPAAILRSLSRGSAHDGFERLVSNEDAFAWNVDMRDRPSPSGMSGIGSASATIPLNRIHVETQISVSSGKEEHTPGQAV